MHDFGKVIFCDAPDGIDGKSSSAADFRKSRKSSWRKILFTVCRKNVPERDIPDFKGLGFFQLLKTMDRCAEERKTGDQIFTKKRKRHVETFHMEFFRYIRKGMDRQFHATFFAGTKNFFRQSEIFIR